MEFNDLGRKELQALAKKYGIKANQSNAVLADAIAKALAADFATGNESNDTKDDFIPESNGLILGKGVVAVEVPAVVSGPFSADNVKFEPIFKSEVSAGNSYKAIYNTGDKVQVCIDDQWVAAVVKRVNKSSFRVLADDGHEVTLKAAEIRQLQTQDESFEVPDVAAINEPALESISELKVVEAEEPSPVKPSSDDIIEETELEMEADNVDLVDATYMDVEKDMTCVDQTFIEEVQQAAPETTIAVQANRLSTPNRRRSSVNAAPQAWDSSIKPVFHIGSAGPKQKKDASPAVHQLKSANKSFASSTPTRKPSIMPKMNATQRLRMEALQKKSQQAAVVTEEPPIKRLKSNPTPTSVKVAARDDLVIVPVPQQKVPKRSSVTFKTKVHFDITTATMSTKKVVPTVPVLDASIKAETDQNVSLLAKRKSTPNFERMHQKNFDRQKSITSCVNRDKKINVNMDKAFEKAQHEIEVKSAASEDELENVKPNVTKTAKAFVTKRSKLNSTSRSKESSESDHLGALLVDEPPKKKAKVDPEAARRKTTALLEHAKKAVPALTSNKRKSAAVVDVKMTNPFKFVA